ncbi:MAG: hypothetical protein ACJAT4_002126 [Granulosicoccus sp.]|jgi:hypothetical protein
MKKFKLLLLCSSLLLVLPFVSSSCSKKSGCPVNETVGKTNSKKGSLSTKRGKSNLFPKKMRKKKRG